MLNRILKLEYAQFENLQQLTGTCYQLPRRNYRHGERRR